jgi:LCP family protein required for cell wall assembly
MLKIPSKYMAPILGVLVLMVVVQFFSNARMARTVALIADNNSKVIDDVGQAKNFVSNFGGDLNEVRSLLLMQTKDYQFDSFIDESDLVVETSTDPIVDLFQTIEHLGEEQAYKDRYTQNQTDLDAYLNSDETLKYLTNKGLYLRSGLNHEIVNNNGNPRITIDYDENGNLRITPHHGVMLEFGDDSTFDEFKESFVAVVEKTPVYDEDESEPEVIGEGVNPFQGKIDELRASVEALANDEGFQATLEKANLQFSFEARETDNAIEYDILNSEGVPIRVIYINKETGEMMIKEPGGNVGSLLKSGLTTHEEILVLPSILDIDSGVKENQNDLNILIGGKHGTNVDTIMFMNIDKKSEKITLISIPRDLYYNSRKINSIYADFGMNEMMRQLSDIVGYRIHKYILIDMYVFSDLIDLVGGVDISLEEDLVDPTYKVREDGEESTLYYASGDHNIDGTEALRIARSRYTTSDYSRAGRQQIIIQGLQEKAKNLGFGDAPTVLKLIKTVLSKTETNIDLDEAAKYYFNYQDYELNRGYVLSSGNVLESVPVPIEGYVTSLKVDVCNMINGEEVCEVKSAIYTLMPRENNWDYIKWFVQEILWK